MAYYIFKEIGKNTGDKAKVGRCSSAIFNYQVLNGQVQFSGSNVPNADVDDDSIWVEIVTLGDRQADTEPFRQHAWEQVRYKVLSGSDVQIYVTSGVAG